MPRFDVLEIRRVRKTLQWLVVPMGVLAVLTLSHPILPLLLCFLALGALVTATYVGFVEEQVDVSGSPWLWMKARTLPCEECTFTKVEKSPTYREPYDAPQPTRVVRRHVHWFTRWVAMMPMAMGGGGLGWRLGWRWVRRTKTVSKMVRSLRRQEALAFVQSTHVGCSGSSCTHCAEIADRMVDGKKVDDGC